MEQQDTTRKIERLGEIVINGRFENVRPQLDELIKMKSDESSEILKRAFRNYWTMEQSRINPSKQLERSRKLVFYSFCEDKFMDYNSIEELERYGRKQINEIEDALQTLF